MRRLTVLFVVIVSFLLLPLPVSADSPSFENLVGRDLPEEVCLAASQGIETHCTSGLMANFIDASSKLFGGVSFVEYSNVKDAASKGNQSALRVLLARMGGSSVGISSFLMNVNYAMLEQRPTSGILFAVNQVDKAFSPEPVLAGGDDGGAAGAATTDPAPYFPGTGFTLLTPIQSFWGWSVTVSYSFMILIIVGVAFALMFRAQIDGTVVVQLQNALPGIVMAMILIPLSYPISGIFVDAITLTTNVYHDFIFGPAGPGRNVYLQGVQNGDPQYNEGRGLYADDWRLNIFRYYERIGVNRLGDIAKIRLCGEPAEGQQDFCTITNGGIATFVDNILQTFLGNSSNVFGGLINLAFHIVAIIVSIRVAKRLLIKLVTLMFLPILSPFIFATLAIPGTGSKNVVTYLKNLAAAALFFVVTYIVMLTTLVLTNEAFFNSIPNVSTYQFKPPLLGDLGLLVSGAVQGSVNNGLGSSGFLFTLIGAFLFLSLPKILDDIDARLGVEQTLIPKALQPYVDDIKYSGDYAFRTALPAAYSVGRSTLNTTWRNTGGLIGRTIGESRSGPFDDTAAEEYVSARRSEINALMEKRANPNNSFMQNRMLDVEIARKRMQANVGANLRGDSSAPFTPKQGEKGVKFSVTLSFPDVEGYMGLTKTLVERLFNSKKKGTSDIPRLVGSLTLEVESDATPPVGTVMFKCYDGATKSIGKMVFDEDPKSSDYFSIILDDQSSYDASRGVVVYSGKAFSGQKRVRMTVLLEHHGSGGNANIKVGSYNLTPKTDVQVRIGEDAYGKQSRFPITIRPDTGREALNGDI